MFFDIRKIIIGAANELQGISEKCTGAAYYSDVSYLSIQKLPEKRSYQSSKIYSYYVLILLQLCKYILKNILHHFCIILNVHNIMTTFLKTRRCLLLWNVVRYTFANKAVPLYQHRSLKIRRELVILFFFWLWHFSVTTVLDEIRMC